MANWQPDVIILRNIQSTDTLFPTIFPLPFLKFFPHLWVYLNINHDLPFHGFNTCGIPENLKVEGFLENSFWKKNLLYNIFSIFEVSVCFFYLDYIYYSIIILNNSIIFIFYNAIFMRLILYDFWSKNFKEKEETFLLHYSSFYLIFP